MTTPREDAEQPTYVHDLYAGATVTDEEVTLDTATLRDLAQKIREIEESRAAAAVSGRDYLIR